MGSQAPGAGEKPGRLLDQDKNTDTPSQKVACPCCEGGCGGAGHRFPVPLLCLGPRRSPLLPSPIASLLPGDPGCTAAHRTLLTRCAPGDGCSACSAPQPADSWLPLFAPGSAPRRLPRPAQPRTPLPQMPPYSLQGRAGELRSWKTHARVQKGESAGEEQRVGHKGWRGLGKEGRGARWRGGESKLSPLGK